ncbi:GNAT family N-acetyltransferase [Arthrobacter pigmenti]
MAGGIGIREAEKVDLPAIGQIQHNAGLLHNDRARLEVAAADPDRFVVVAEVDGRVAGWAKTHYWPDGDGVAPAGHYSTAESASFGGSHQEYVATQVTCA